MSRISDSEVNIAAKNWDEVNAWAAGSARAEISATRVLATALVFSATMLARAIENTKK